MTTGHLSPEKPTIFWMPGCSSCLRLKEFMEGTGLAFDAINVEEDDAAAEFLAGQNVRLPAISWNGTCRNGVALASVAELLGVPYSPPVMLDPAELVRRYDRVNTVLQSMLRHLTPETEGLRFPHRRRDLAELFGHAGCTMRYFLGKFDDAEFSLLFDDLEPEARDAADLGVFIEGTRRAVAEWWEDMDPDDPMDDVLDSYWGAHTMHELLEREVWHAAQHTRQIAHLLQEAAVQLTDTLSDDDLDGLPVPRRIYA
ncbi:glutaredoxin family protein [Microbacterium sp. NPDC058342]|uniref:glutaredoxin family protein n=1 Tax=Microbacterium sp. NPDC058342 TaxID=3346454 RepID=UPI0036620C7C